MDDGKLKLVTQAGPQRAESRRSLSTRSKSGVCTACRQSKVRCTGSNNGSCERCTRLGLDCHRDSRFKRISKDRKLAELEKQVQQLASAVNPVARQSLEASQFQPTPLLIESQITANIDDATTEPNSTSENHIPTWQQLRPSSPCNPATNCVPVAQSSSFGPVTTPVAGIDTVRSGAILCRTLEAVQIDTVQIDLLFQTYFEHYHEFLPFLDPSRSPDDYYKSGISLFWAIIGVASRRFREDIMLLHVLSDLVMKLIWAEISKPPYKVPTVQAIILLSTWPFPTTTTYNDVSATLSSLAISTAMQLGLHRPFNRQDFVRAKANASVISDTDSGTLIRTWAVANIVSQSSAALVGQLPHAPFDWTIDRACETGNIYTLPNELRFKLIIQKYCNRISKATCNIDSDIAGSWKNDVAILEVELNSFENENRKLFTSIDELYLAAARLYLHAFHFFDSSRTESRKHSILKAYESAVKFISLFTSADATSGLLLYLSYYHFGMLLIATCIILKVLKSSYGQELGDSVYGKKTLNEAIFTLLRSSVSNNDTAGKAVKLVSQMWYGNGGSKGLSPPELAITSRGGASIVYDFVLSWRKEFGGLSRKAMALSNAAPAQQSSPTQLPSLFEEYSIFNLDFLDDPGWDFGTAESLISSTMGP